jgi:hypothetical protein
MKLLFLLEFYWNNINLIFFLLSLSQFFNN